MVGFTRIKHWFENQMIRNKIIIMYLPLIIIPLFIQAYVSSSIFSKIIIEKTKKNIYDNSGLIISRIESKLESVENCANTLVITLNKVLVEELTAGIDPMTDLNLQNKIRNQLSFALLLFPDVESVAFIDVNGKIYGSDALLEYNEEKTIKSKILEEIDTTSGNNIWFEMQTRDYLTTDKNVPVLTLGKRIVNIYTGQKLGSLVLNIKENSLSDIYKKVDIGLSGHYYIVDNKGVIISSQNQDDVLKRIDDFSLLGWILNSNNTTEIMTLNGIKVLVARNRFQNSEFNLVCQIPLNALTSEIKDITLIIVLIGIACLLFALWIAGKLSRLLVEPIIKLSNNMSKVKEGNIDVYCDITTSDEIGLLASGFNTMIKRIKLLIDNVYKEQKKKREYELALIQSQIKPHFLYNTLDVIYVLAEMNKIDGVKKTTKALADFYRSVLSSGREIITIEEEIKMVKEYLFIQKIRFPDVFDFEIDIDKDILKNCIVKLTIQPIVENAIYHGLRKKGTFGNVVIKGYSSNDKIIIKIIDDGIGVSEENLKKILENKNIDKKTSFGICSVHDRIRLFFGEKYGLDIKSKPGEGTEVTISLPKSEKGIW
ncbi:MAG TPA: histidine kinase [Clostridiaceae bacterium]|nr:histidine kinase [Clostridiaceae bacterium]